MSDYIDTVFFGFGSASGAGPEAKAENHRVRRLRSTSAAFCDACERGTVVAEEPRLPMGFAIPKVEP